MRFQTLFEGRWIFGVLFCCTAIAFYAAPVLAIIPGILILFCVNFFRDPERRIAEDPALLVSAADGVVTAVEEVEETEVTGVRMVRISVFLSVFNVHVNRAPIAGKVAYVRHFPGTYLDARNPESSVKNEAMTWMFEQGDRKIVVRQITGAIARRIVAWASEGDVLQKGDRFGMIRFGSRTEVYVPCSSEILVKPGDKVSGGSTVIARFC